MTLSAADEVLPREQLLARIAWLYYEQDLTQAEIGARLGLSRVTVNRLLKEARASGIVEVRIRAGGSQLPLTAALLQRYPLQDAWVCPLATEGEALHQALAQTAAQVLRHRLQDGMTVGIGIGRTLSYLPDAFQSETLLRCRFTSLTGGLSAQPPAMAHNFDILNRLAAATGGEAHYLPLPGYVSAPATRESLLADPLVKTSLQPARCADLALFSVGAADYTALLHQSGVLTDTDLAELNQMRAVGDVLGRFFDDSGEEVPAQVHQRLIGLTLAELRRIPIKILVAGGENKRRALRAALRSRLADVLVTDPHTAEWLVDLDSRKDA